MTLIPFGLPGNAYRFPTPFDASPGATKRLPGCTNMCHASWKTTTRWNSSAKYNDCEYVYNLIPDWILVFFAITL